MEGYAGQPGGRGRRCAPHLDKGEGQKDVIRLLEFGSVLPSWARGATANAQEVFLQKAKSPPKGRKGIHNDRERKRDLWKAHFPSPGLAPEGASPALSKAVRVRRKKKVFRGLSEALFFASARSSKQSHVHEGFVGDHGNVAGDARPRHVRGVCPGLFGELLAKEFQGGPAASLPALNAGLVGTRRVSLPTGRSATMKVTTLARTSSC